MKHAASRELYAYWEEKRGTRPAPERAEIEPGAIRGILSDAFILALDRSAGHPNASCRYARLCIVRPRAERGTFPQSLEFSESAGRGQSAFHARPTNAQEQLQA